MGWELRSLHIIEAIDDFFTVPSFSIKMGKSNSLTPSIKEFRIYQFSEFPESDENLNSSWNIQNVSLFHWIADCLFIFRKYNVNWLFSL